MDNLPPSYNEAVGLSSIDTSSVSFCWNCGQRVSISDKERNQCPSCQCILVQNLHIASHNISNFDQLLYPDFISTTSFPPPPPTAPSYSMYVRPIAPHQISHSSPITNQPTCPLEFSNESILPITKQPVTEEAVPFSPVTASQQDISITDCNNPKLNQQASPVLCQAPKQNRPLNPRKERKISANEATGSSITDDENKWTPQSARKRAYSDPSSHRKKSVNEQHNIPNRDVKDMSVRRGNRLYIDYEKDDRCGEYIGFDPRVKDCVPTELKSKGITQQQWSGWMNELHDIQKLAPSVLGGLCIFCFPGLFLQAILCSLLCPISYNHPLSFLPCCYGDWYEKLRLWQKGVNKVLNTKLMHVKLVTYKPYTSAPRSKLYNERINGKGNNYEMSFLVIALTKEESEMLIKESWNHGVSDNSCSEIGRCL